MLANTEPDVSKLLDNQFINNLFKNRTSTFILLLKCDINNHFINESFEPLLSNFLTWLCVLKSLYKKSDTALYRIVYVPTRYIQSVCWGKVDDMLQ